MHLIALRTPHHNVLGQSEKVHVHSSVNLMESHVVIYQYYMYMYDGEVEIYTEKNENITNFLIHM